MARPLEPALQVFRGLVMGAADVVPGVSGGTVAMVFGIYTDLVAQIRQGASALAQLVQGRPGRFVEKLRAVRWSFMLPLLAGIAVAVIALAGFITHHLDEEPVRTAAVFFGLVVGSVLTSARLVPRWDRHHVAMAAVVGAVTFVVLGFGSGQIEDPSLAFVFVGGAIAICAMILPGLSGSFLLLMLGLYHYVLDGVDQRDLTVIVVFGVGAVLGLALFSSALSWALGRYHDIVFACAIGLMIGSLRVLWPWPNGTGTGAGGSTDGTELALPAGDVWWPVALAVIAAVAIVVVSRLAGAKELVEDVETVPEPG